MLPKKRVNELIILGDEKGKEFTDVMNDRLRAWKEEHNLSFEELDVVNFTVAVRLMTTILNTFPDVVSCPSMKKALEKAAIRELGVSSSIPEGGVSA